LGVAAPAASQGPSPAQASSALQQAVQQNPGLPDQIRQRLLQSGLTAEQVRARLSASGYAPNLLDAYLGGASSGGALSGGALPAGALELSAIQALGLPPVDQTVLAVDTGLIRMRGAYTPSRVYSGVKRGPGATTRFDITVANVRANQVYVVGEVTQPGAYQISSLGTALTALYAAGGVTERANMRDIVVQRAGKTVATLDLYDYLLPGETRNDIRL